MVAKDADGVYGDSAPATYTHAGSDGSLDFPIAWNTLDVVGNPTTSDGAFVKISDITPTSDDLSNVIMYVYNEGVVVESYQATHIDAINGVLLMYIGVDVGLISCHAPGLYEGITFPEAGLYTFNIGATGEDMDLVVDLSDPTNSN